MTPRPRLGLAALAAAWACVAAPARGDEVRVSVSLTPAFVHVGEVAHYRGVVVVPYGEAALIRWLPPDTLLALSWGPPSMSRRAHRQQLADTSLVETTVQAFQLGNVVVPGLRFVDDARAPGVVRRLPMVRLTVIPVIPANDTSADLRPVRGPIAAPWWEVVPWGWVIGIAALAALIVWLLRRPRRRTVMVPQPAPRMDPAEAALQRLQALKARRLPEAGEFGQHALELTAILRRFLEATTPRLRPGSTTAELSRELEDEAVPADEARVLVNLMRVWDRVKFARAPFTLEEARKSEEAVEAFVRRRQRVPHQEAA
jgi:hypothetical protein